MGKGMEAELEARLLRYTAIDSQSDATSSTSPSTARQFAMLTLLRDELTEIGAEDVVLTRYGAVLATIPASPGVTAPTIGLLAHVDTAPAFHAEGVKPRVHRAWDGSPITFPEDEALILDPAASPYLASRIGHDIITASGATLLGADDKAGVAIIMTAARALLADPALPRPRIRIAFTPDEEIGRGVDVALPADLGAAVAYTFDGGELGEIVDESFSADGARIRIQGVSTHTATAKGVMVNALTLAAKLVDTLPLLTLTPETTEGREGFIHLHRIAGTAADVEMDLILRDFELDGLAAHGALLRRVCETIAATEPRARISCTISPQYRNMRYWLDRDPRPVELAEEACRRAGIPPFRTMVRGGTDGSRLTEMGVPCPNIFTGMQMIHGPLEWISVQDMAAATRTCLALAALWAAEPAARTG